MATPIDTSTLCLEGELTIYNAADTKARLAEGLGRPGGLAVDLSAVTEVDSAGLQLLVLARREADRLGILGLLDAPSGGEYWFDGQNVAGWNERRLNTLRRGRIGFVFQSFNLIDDLTVADNIALALEYGELPARARRERVTEVMERLGIAHRAGHRPSQLSGGQQQRVAIARAIAARPALLLADEPTGNLDSAHGAEVMRILRELNAEGTTLVMVTHSLEHAAQASRTLRLLDGRVVVDAMSAMA